MSSEESPSTTTTTQRLPPSQLGSGDSAVTPMRSTAPQFAHSVSTNLKGVFCVALPVKGRSAGRSCTSVCPSAVVFTSASAVMGSPCAWPGTGFALLTKGVLMESGAFTMVIATVCAGVFDKPWSSVATTSIRQPVAGQGVLAESKSRDSSVLSMPSVAPIWNDLAFAPFRLYAIVSSSSASVAAYVPSTVPRGLFSATWRLLGPSRTGALSFTFKTPIVSTTSSVSPSTSYACTSTVCDLAVS